MILHVNTKIELHLGLRTAHNKCKNDGEVCS
jgi:hypothetical protein